MGITDRYASAVHSNNLHVSKENDKAGEARIEDTDVLGAMGLADKHMTNGWRTVDPSGTREPVRPSKIAVPLVRLFAGDNTSVHELVRHMANEVYEQSWKMKIKISRVQCVDMARACLAWHRDGVCKVCGGHGFDIIPGTKHLSTRECQPCNGSGKVPFHDQWKGTHLALAQWLIDQITRESGRAGPQAMRALSEKFNINS